MRVGRWICEKTEKFCWRRGGARFYTTIINIFFIKPCHRFSVIINGFKIVVSRKPMHLRVVFLVQINDVIVVVQEVRFIVSGNCGSKFRRCRFCCWVIRQNAKFFGCTVAIINNVNVPIPESLIQLSLIASSWIVISGH